MNNYINLIIAISVIRGFFAFLFIPVLWFLFPSNSIFIPFWENSFFNKGINIYDFASLMLGLLFYFSFILVILFRNKAEKVWGKIFCSLNNKTNWFNCRDKQLEIFTYLSLILWLVIKLKTIVFNFEYFEHAFFELSYFNAISQKIITHIFLPNVLLITGAFILFSSGEKVKQFCGGILLFFAMLASINYGSRGLFSITFFITIIVILSKIKVNKAIIAPIFFIPILVVFFMAYSGQNLLDKLYGLILRLDMYHIVLQAYLYGDFDISQGINEYSRRIGLVAWSDHNTGVGFPLFITINNGFSYFIAFLSGSFIALFITLVSYIFKVIPALGGVIFWTLLYVALHWVEMNAESYLILLRNILVIFLVYLFSLYFCKYLNSR